MAVIAQTNGVLSSNGGVNVTRTALTASDTLTYFPGAGQTVVLYNTTASPVVATFVGTAPTPVVPQGFGGSVSTAGGKAITVPASQTTVVRLDSIGAFLTGTNVVTVTGGTGLTAHLFV